MTRRSVAVGLGVVLAGCCWWVAGADPAAAAVPCVQGANHALEARVGAETAADPAPGSTNAAFQGVMDWGDGSPPTRWGNGDHDLAHRWAKAGTFRIVLRSVSGTTQGSDGRQAPCANDAVPFGTMAVLPKLVAAFSVRHGKVANVAVLDASGSGPDAGRWEWTFDDGKRASGVVASHPFNRGQHVVSLRVGACCSRFPKIRSRVLSEQARDLHRDGFLHPPRGRGGCSCRSRRYLLRSVVERGVRFRPVACPCFV